MDDLVVVTDLLEGDVINAYDSAVGGKLLGTTKVQPGQKNVSITINQLGTTTGAIFVTVTRHSAVESGRVKIDYLSDWESPTVSSKLTYDSTIYSDQGVQNIITWNIKGSEKIMFYYILRYDVEKDECLEEIVKV